MSFREPLLLAGLALVPLAVAAYVAAQRRRRRYAVHYTNVDLVAHVARAGWGRHVPTALALLAPGGLGGTRRLPAAIVLLSDGASTRGEDPIDVAQRAKKAGIRIYAVALGTPGGVLETTRPDGTVKRENVPPDTLTLQEIARETGG